MHFLQVLTVSGLDGSDATTLLKPTVKANIASEYWHSEPPPATSARLLGRGPFHELEDGLRAALGRPPI